MVVSDTVVQLSLSCSDLRVRDRLSHSDPMCVVYMKCGVRGNWTEVGRTETVSNTGDPEWVKSFNINFHFHEKQELRFCVYDIDDKDGDLSGQDNLGSVECSLAQILAKHKMSLFLSPYRSEPGDCGVLFVRGVEMSDGTRDKVTLDLTAQNLDKKDLFSESDPFYLIYRNEDDGSDTLVYRSEWIKDTASPDWKPVTLDCAKLCLGDWSRKLRLEVFDWDGDGSHDFIGDYTTCMDELAQAEDFQILQFDVVNQKKKDKKGDSYVNSGQIIVKAVKIEQDSSFLDFVRGGLKINLVVAVDMTASNIGVGQQYGGLHQVGTRSGDNVYTTAIRTVGDILQDYDYDKRILGLGFGAKLDGSGVSHCFPLNGNSRDPYCSGVEGLLSNYRNTLDSVSPCEPTRYSEVLQFVLEDIVRATSEVEYTVVLMITDGGVSDFRETKDVLVKMSSHPISVVLVGVGEGDMSSLVKLDSDRARLCSGDIQAERDIVQFVELKKFLPAGSLDPAEFRHELEPSEAKLKLARAVLMEIPRQVTEFMRKAGIGPRVPDIPTFTEDFDSKFGL